ncbi:MAG: alpha/beta hydrolase [Mycobacteriaceae bacterium]|nr:alpha/beta hydrolase [Mycobacteriaceae bacterium]
MPTITTRTGTVAYAETGAGRPVLLLHATLHDRRDFDPIVAPLARRHRVIALDWPSHGDSQTVENPTGPLLADVLDDVIDALNLKGVVLIGNSVGGSAAARLAITRPELVAGLVLVNTGGFVPATAVTKVVCRLMGTEAVARRVLAKFVPAYMKAQTPNDDAIVARAVARARTREGVRTAASLWRSFGTPEYDLRGRAHCITAPTLIVWGDRDPTLSLRIGKATQRAIPASTLHRLPTGHVVFSSDPTGFLGVVGPFLAGIDGAGRRGRDPQNLAAQ